MLELVHITNRYQNRLYLNDIHLKIENSTLYAISGDDQAGMYALLRTIAGVYRPDMGEVLLDGKPVYEDEDQKRRVFLMGSNMFLRPRTTVRSAMDFYAGYHEDWDQVVMQRLLQLFRLDLKKRVHELTPEELQYLKLSIAFSVGTKCLMLENPLQNIRSRHLSNIQKMMRSYAKDRKAVVITTQEHIQAQKTDRYGYMTDSMLLDNVTEEEYREADENKRITEGEVYELEHFFR